MKTSLTIATALLAAVGAACSGSTTDAPVVDDVGSETIEGEDTAVVIEEDTAVASDARADSAKKDSTATETTLPDTTPPDTMVAADTADADAGPPAETTCNSTAFVTPSGNSLAYQRCDSARTWVVRNFAKSTTRTIGSVYLTPILRKEGLLYMDAMGTHLTDADGDARYTLPAVGVPSDKASRVFVDSTHMIYATQAATSSTVDEHDERFVFRMSDKPTPVQSGTFRVLRSPYSDIVLSEDGTLAASLERYPSELKSRLRVAAVAEGSAVKTYELTLFEPRWLNGSVSGKGALMVAEWVGYLFHVDFATGATTKLSTEKALSSTTKTQEAYGISVGPYVYFVEGLYRGTRGGLPGAYTLKKWDSRTPTVAAVTVASGTDYRSEYLAGDPPMRLTPDGKFLIYKMEPPSCIACGVHHVVDLATGVDRRFDENRFDVFAPSILAYGPYSGALTVENLASGAKRTFGAQTFATPARDGDTVYLTTVVSDFTAKTASVKLERGSISAAPVTTLLDRPKSAINYSANARSVYPVLADAAVLQIPRPPSTPSTTEYDLLMFAK